MKKTVVFLFFTCLISTVGVSQSSMDQGFKMLEAGQFAQAADFFHTYLKTDSTNQTALLCYGRGVGLSGKTDEAKTVFKKLQERFPANYEIDLNMAEAFMWSKEYKTALLLYENLVERDAKNFAALLGYANAFSENKNYDEALRFVEKALEVQAGNLNALVSQKFMRLGKASLLVNDGKFDEALLLYQLILQQNPNDIDALMNKSQALMTAKRYDEAKIVYQQLVSIPEKKVDGLLGLSQVASSQKFPKIALQWANQAVMYADSTSFLKANLGKVNALGWNKDFKGAFSLLENLKQKYPSNLEVLSGFGRINIWSKGFAKGAKVYQELLEKQPSSFDGNLGYADANHAQGLDNESFKYVRKTLGYYANQRDALQFLERLHIAHDPTISTHTYFSSDNGKNQSQNYLIKATFDPTPLLRTHIAYYQRVAENVAANDATGRLQIQQYSAGAEYRINGFLKVGSRVSLLQSPKKNFLIGDITTEWKLGKFQILELNYTEEFQNFTAGLIDRNLKMKNFTANYNLSLPSKLGVYSQLIHTQISDNNTRNLLFTSFYYDIKQSPVLKAGVNFSTFSFKNQVPSVYFSPDIFKGYELFMAAENTNEPTAKWLYQATVAGGLQKISTEDFQGIYRFDIKSGVRFNNRLWAMAYFMRSNSAASSVQGFTYNEWGLKARWIIAARLL